MFPRHTARWQRFLGHTPQAGPGKSPWCSLDSGGRGQGALLCRENTFLPGGQGPVPCSKGLLTSADPKVGPWCPQAPGAPKGLVPCWCYDQGPMNNRILPNTLCTPTGSSVDVGLFPSPAAVASCHSLSAFNSRTVQLQLEAGSSGSRCQAGGSFQSCQGALPGLPAAPPGASDAIFSVTWLHKHHPVSAFILQHSLCEHMCPDSLLL